MWLNQLMEDFNIKSRYELSKRTGIRETSLSSIVTRKTPYGNIKFDIMCKIADDLGITLDELRIKLNEYDKSTTSN